MAGRLTECRNGHPIRSSQDRLASGHCRKCNAANCKAYAERTRLVLVEARRMAELTARNI